MTRAEEYAKILAEGTPYDQMIRDAADANGVNYEYLHKKIFNESSFNPNAKSPTGPLGLGQFTKATGKAYGLATDADRLDPLKAINASAQLTRDLLGTYKGDYLKAALAYNQGNGKLGAPQLAALDRGDFSGISKEGQNYMVNLLDVAGDSPSRKWFDQPNAPKQSGDFEKYTSGITGQPKVQRVAAPERQGFDLSEGEAPAVQQTFRERELAQNGVEDDSWFKNFMPGVEAAIDTSYGGMKLRDLFRTEEFDPLDEYKTHDTNWTDEEFEAIRQQGVPPQMFSFLMDRTKGNRDALPEAIAVAKENWQREQEIAKSGIGTQLAGGLIAAPLDPVSYVPIPGVAGATFARRVAAQAAATSALSVGSEYVRSEATGLEAHYAAAAVGGAVMGGAMAGVLDRYIAKGVSNSQARPDMDDLELERILARHGESSEQNALVDLVDGNQPEPRVQREDFQDDDYIDKILGMHGERGNRQEGIIELPDDTVEGILARHGESSEANSFYGTNARLMAREEARLAGQDDPTRMPWNSDDVPQSHDGVDFVDVPGEPGAVRLRDGSIISATNPMNPKTQQNAARLAAQIEPERSAAGVNLGAITEIGYKLNRTEDAEIRAIGGQLFRSTVQTESGTNGKFGATASDVIERIRGEDHLRYGRLNELTDKVLSDDPSYAVRGGVQAKRERAYRRAAEAIEDTTGAKASALSSQERELMDLLVEHFTRKQDMLENPAQFGNPNAVSLLDNTRHGGSYIPNIYDDAAKAMNIARFGGQDGLQRAIVESWMASYASRPAVKARIDRMIKDAIEADGRVATPEAMRAAVERYANDKAYGISHTADFNRSSMIDDGLNSLVGAENNNFLEGRNLFDSDVAVPLTDGSTFSVNDLRLYDMAKIMTSYDRRINGDVGIMAATGMDTEAMKQAVLRIKTKQGNGGDVDALEDAVKLLTGRARRDPDSAFGTMLRSLNDLSFFTKNAYMGAQNFTEIAGMATNGHLRMMLHGVPFLREMTTWGSKISPANLKEMHGIVFGRELDDAIRPRRLDIIDRLRSQKVNDFAANVIGTWKYGTQELAARSPFTKFLTETSNYIIEAGRQGALMDMVRAAHGAEVKIATPERLNQLSITPAQFDSIKGLIREQLVPDGNGFKIKDPAALRSDPRTMDMWRLGDKIADETLLRPHKLSSQDSKALGAGWHMALQFKKFVLRSLNARVMRTFYNVTKSGQKLDTAIQVGLSIGLATGFYVAQRYVQSQGMSPEKRKDFLQTAFTPEMLGYAALSRGNIIGAPIGAAGFFAAPLGYDPAAAVRTSILPRGPEYEKRDRPVRYAPGRSAPVQDFTSRAFEQVPAAGLIYSGAQVGLNWDGAFGDSNRNSQREGYMTGVYNGLKGLVPNDPLTQRAITALMESQGMEYRKR